MIIISTNEKLINELKSNLSCGTPRIYSKNKAEARKYKDLDIKVLSFIEYKELENNYEIYSFSPYFSYNIHDIEEFSASSHLALWGSKHFADSLKEAGMQVRFINFDHEADDEQIQEKAEEILDSLDSGDDYE